MRQWLTVRLPMILVLVGLAAGVGCVRQCVPVSVSRDREWVDLNAPPDAHAPISPTVIREVADAFRRRGDGQHPSGAKPYQMLALSGGGVYGAFGVGVLNGWTAAGTRPQFDVVTGISTGAIMSTFAFVGPKYDAFLKNSVIEDADERDIIRRLPLAAVPLAAALYSSRPLMRQIRRAVTAELLVEVAQAHAEGRRLYVGTTNLDTRRLVIWDMGAIASRGTPEALELYHKILLASSSIPVAFPAVRIPIEVDGKKYDEMHVDGGVSDEVIFRGFMVGDRNRANGGIGSWAPPGSTLYVITNGKLYADASCVKRRVFSIFQAGVRSLIYGKARDEFYRIYLNCLETGLDLRLTAVPQALSMGANALQLNREEREMLFQAGFRVGQESANGPHWRDLPPGSDATEQTLPRSGTQFLTQPKPGVTPTADCVRCQ